MYGPDNTVLRGICCLFGFGFKLIKDGAVRFALPEPAIDPLVMPIHLKVHICRDDGHCKTELFYWWVKSLNRALPLLLKDIVKFRSPRDIAAHGNVTAFVAVMVTGH